MRIDRKWAMPSRHTFTIKPIKDLLKDEITNGLWIDPFAGENSPVQETNDLNLNKPTKYHLEAIDFIKKFRENSVDGVLLDPPYSPRQVKECYENIGLNCTNDKTKMNFWSDYKNEIARVIKKGGKVISFGWNSMGIGKSRGFRIKRILLIPHGGAKNDTICTVEIKE